MSLPKFTTGFANGCGTNPQGKWHDRNCCPQSARAGGVILCGGRSSRMGQPKAWLPLGPEVMLQRVVRVIRESVDAVVVVAAPGQDLPSLPADVLVVRDPIEGKGPLAGLVAGLTALQGRVEVTYLSACDVPLLKSAFVGRVLAGLAGGAHRAAVPLVEGCPHPLAAAYHLTVLPTAAAFLAAGRLRLTDLLAALPTRYLAAAELAEADPALESLRNVNTPEEYAAVARSLS